jgi:hypothetical protein
MKAIKFHQKPKTVQQQPIPQKLEHPNLNPSPACSGGSRNFLRWGLKNLTTKKIIRNAPSLHKANCYMNAPSIKPMKLYEMHPHHV